MTTPKLALPELAVGQAGKEMTHNDALAILDQLVQARVIDKDLTTPPGSPSDGAAYIVPSGATGTWSGQAGKIAYFRSAVGVWRFLAPLAGWQVWVIDESKFYRFNGTVWSEVPTAPAGAGGEGASTGVVSGLTLSIGTPNTTISIAAGIMRHVDYTVPDVPVSTNYPIAAINNLAISGIGTRPETYIGIDKTGAVLQSANPLTEAQLKTYAQVGVAVHTNLTNVNAVNVTPNSVLAIGNQFQAFLKQVMGNLNLEGNVVSANGANLNINKSAGILWGLGLGGTAGLLNAPNTVATGAATPQTFRYRNQTGETGGDVTLIDPTTYDVAGVTTAVPGATNFTVQRVYIFPSGLVRIQRGQAVYATKEEALNGITSEAFVAESNIRRNGTAIGFIVVRKNATALNNTAECEFRNAGKFGIVAGGSVALTSAAIVAALGFTPENVANKATDLSTPNDTKYPTTLAVSTALGTKQPLAAPLTALSSLATGADKMPYYNGVNTAAETPLTPFARTLLDDADAATAMTTLGAQPADAFLTSIAALGTAADRMIYTTGVDTAAETPLTAFARTLLDDTTATAARTTLDAASISSSNTFLQAQNIAPASGNANVDLRAPASGNSASFVFRTGASIRWWLQKNLTAETGSDAGSDFVFLNYSDAGSAIGQVITAIRATGYLRMPGVYAQTTASAANVFVDSSGNLMRSTSAVAYKKDIEAVTLDYAKKLFNVTPIFYRSTCPSDNPAWSWYGWTAEEMAEHLPQLAQWKTTRSVKHVDGTDENGDEIARFTDEPLDTPIPVGIAYERTAPLLSLIAEHHDEEIASLKAQLTELTGIVAGLAELTETLTKAQ